MVIPEPNSNEIVTSATIEEIVATGAHDGGRWSLRCRRVRWRLALLHALLATAVTTGIASAYEAPCTVPSGTRIHFRLLKPLSSNESKTGQAFDFVLLEPIQSGSCEVPVNGAKGVGTVYLAGASGSAGHEGDLTLRLDSIQTPEGRVVTFDDQRIEINGRNRKIASAALGFVPFVGLGAHFIRGSDISIDDATPIETVLLRPATIADEPSPSASAPAPAAPSAAPAPAAPSAVPAPSASPS